MSKERILVVGDLHGDWGRLNSLLNKHGPDILLQAGDFGWWPRMELKKPVLYGQQDKWILKGVKPQGTMVYWLDGNHEDHDDLDSLGRRQKSEILCYENVIYKPRGTTLTLKDGRVVLFMGGADSIDKHMRTQGFDWFPRELPCKSEEDRALQYDHIDIVVSHTVPYEWIPDIGRADKLLDPTRNILSAILEKYQPSLWFSGHWHKYSHGRYKNTRWFSLDYPGHHGRWWVWLS